jgi:heptaprenyl diphosphate synthase
VLLQEIFRSETLQNFRCGWAFWHVFQSGTSEERKQLLGESTEIGKLRAIVLKYNSTSELYRMLEEQLAQVFAKIRELGTDKLAKELLQIGEPFLRFLSKPKVLEEI